MLAGGANDPRDETAAPSDDGAVRDTPQTLSHSDLLAGPGLKGALFAQWGRQKRRTALQQRYGEEAEMLVDDGSDNLLWDEWSD